MDSVTDAVRRLIDTLESSGVEYAFGGAIALAAWSEPRATADVDIVLFVADGEHDKAVDAVEAAGVVVDRRAALLEAAARGLFVGRIGRVRIDAFVPSIPYYDEARVRRVRTEIAGRPTWVHSAEALAVFKMLFFRPKDLIDIVRMLEVRGSDFDRTHVRSALVEMLDEDERISKWDELCARVPAPTPIRS